MPRARNIKPGFFKNEYLAELLPEARLLFIGLWTLADREGRLEDRPKRIKMEIFPADDFSVNDLLDSLHKAGFIMRYNADKEYIQINNFVKHQMPHHKEVPSVIPAPDGVQQITRHSYNVPNEVREIIFNRDGNACLRCNSTVGLSIDHINPLAKGGDNSKDNLQTLCSKCNSSKGDSIKDYRKANVEPTLNQRNLIEGASCPSDSPILNPEPPSLNPESLNPLPEEELKKSFSKGGSYNVEYHLNDTGRAYAKMNAPGWDMYELIKIYNEGIANGTREPPANANTAFPAWCTKYTKGKQL